MQLFNQTLFSKVVQMKYIGHVFEFVLRSRKFGAVLSCFRVFSQALLQPEKVVTRRLRQHILGV